jgi:hypothetical protein
MWTPTYVYELINFIGNKQTEQKIVRIPSSRRFQSTKGFTVRAHFLTVKMSLPLKR